MLQEFNARHRIFCLFFFGVFVVLASEPGRAQTNPNEQQLRERFGEQQFGPPGGFVLRVGQRLPKLVWANPKLVAKVVDDLNIPTRWFNEHLEEVQVASKAGRYYAYGEAPAPQGPVIRRAMTCCCVARDFDLPDLAKQRIENDDAIEQGERQREIERTLQHWRTSEQGAIELAAIGQYGKLARPSRKGQWQMEEATRHVHLKRKLMGWSDKPIVKATPKKLAGPPAHILRRAPLEESGITSEQVKDLQSHLDQWYAHSKEPMAVVVAHQGVIVVSRAYGKVNGRPVTVNTSMALDSAMKPLIGLQLATYVDRGLLSLDEPIGNYLPDFNTPQDRKLTFRAGHVHATGIHFPWDLAFSRLFYFHTWHESLIAHCKREWRPGARRRYGVVGVILSVRALELLRGRNYWDAMERDLFLPLGIRDARPHNGFSAEGLARLGVLLANRGKYGSMEVFSERTYRAILPTSLEPYFPNIKTRYGIGLQDAAQHLGAGSFGHGGGCGTLLVVNPHKHLVFAMVRNAPGKDFKNQRAKATTIVKNWLQP